MSMVTQSLTVGTWYQFTSLDDPSVVQFYLNSSDVVIAALEASTPDSSSPGFLCVGGMNQFLIPLGKSCWVKLASGTADVIYSQFDGILIDAVKCAFARTDAISIDEVLSNVFPIAGYDDSATDTIEHVGLLHTEAANVASAATIAAATITLQFSSFRTGRMLRIYGIEEAASITLGLTDYASLASGQTLTTAFEDVTIDSSGFATVDLTAILQELVDDTPSWTTSSPVQLWIGDNGSSPSSGLNETATIITSGRGSALFIRT